MLSSYSLVEKIFTSKSENCFEKRVLCPLCYICISDLIYYLLIISYL